MARYAYGTPVAAPRWRLVLVPSSRAMVRAALSASIALASSPGATASVAWRNGSLPGVRERVPYWLAW